jgi:putative spermidine/putrescine transport system ATP-binding protein
MSRSVSEVRLTARSNFADCTGVRNTAGALSAGLAGSPGDAAPSMELRQVVKSYGAAPAVDGVSLALARGEFLTLLGPSGCGKTTLLNMIAGFFPPTSGEIWIAGRNVTSLPSYQRNTGVVFQNYALFPHMTVEQNVAFGLVERRVPRAEIRQRVAEALNMVKLADFGGRRPTQLSGGQQQRVALARALVIKPQVLLLDEPLSALDKNLRSHMQIELKQIQKQARVATVFVTHDQAEALSLSDRIIVMNKGRIEQIGSPQEVYRHPRSSFVASFVGEVSRIRGEVLEASSEATVVSIANGLQLRLAAWHQASFAPGDQIELFVRPENIAILDADLNRPDLIPGRIVARSYQGSHTQVVVEAEGLGTIMVTVPGNEMPGTLSGSTEKIWLEIALAHASVMPA